mmetsp:Transcript_131188/g.419667  ORF Transcript_131188/g.419667 Transcript_131188/m.419667 type:complete len:113 (-) Transcript_131188:63-401(-)
MVSFPHAGCIPWRTDGSASLLWEAMCRRSATDWVRLGGAFGKAQNSGVPSMILLTRCGGRRGSDEGKPRPLLGLSGICKAAASPWEVLTPPPRDAVGENATFWLCLFLQSSI